MGINKKNTLKNVEKILHKLTTTNKTDYKNDLKEGSYLLFIFRQLK